MYSLRPAAQDDFEFLYCLHVITMREYIETTWGWQEAWQQEHFTRKFDPARRQIIQIAGQDAGVLTVEWRDNELYIGLIELLPEFQGIGIGTAVITDICTQAHQQNHLVSLHVLKTNDPARRLYERLGFTIVADEEIRYKMTCMP